jgi:hypothetical protein
MANGVIVPTTTTQYSINEGPINIHGALSLRSEL